MSDRERTVSIPIDGFPGVAAFIARDPDSETYVFRKFKTLTARALLHKQSELVDLERQLYDFDYEATSSTQPEPMRSLRNWEFFEKHAASDTLQAKRKGLIDDIETKLQRYHKMLLIESEVAKLDGPSDRVLKAYQNDFKGGANGTEFKLGGRSEEILDDRRDLVALKQPHNKDLLSTLLLNQWLFSTKDLTGRYGSCNEKPRARYFEESTLLKLVNIVSTLIAGALLIGSILIFYFVTQPDLRLGLVILFMVLFAIGMGLTTGASRDSMFAATAAYAAVLVVSISGNLGTDQGGKSP